MHPILSDNKRIIIYLVAWFIVSILFAASMVYILHGEILISSLITIPVMMVYSQINLSSWYIAKAFPLGKTNAGKIIGIVIVSSVVISGLFVILCNGWIYVLSRFVTIPQPEADTWLLNLLLYGLGEELYLVSLAVSYLFAAFEDSRTAERRAFELRLLAQSAELKALRMQIDPHFLFNSLNSISALTVHNAEGARSMTMTLADFFRKSLLFGAKESITLKEELSLLNHYLDIEKIRFGKRLTIQENIEEAALNCYIPPLLLQPLLENAIKHGIANTLEGGTILISAQKKSNRLFLSLENPIDPDAPKRKGTGLGMDIVKKRLQTAYGDDGDLKTFVNEKYFQVIIFLPVKEHQ